MASDASREALELRAYKIRDAAEIARDKIARALESYPELKELSYDIKNRIKNVSRMVEKVHNGRINGPEDLTDVCGFRIVTHYQSGVAQAMHHLLRLVSHNTKSECIRFVHMPPGTAQNLCLRVGVRVPMSCTSI